MNKVIKLLVDKQYRFGVLTDKEICKYSWLNDVEFTKRKWKNFFGKELNLDNPKTFNEKIQWLKLFYHEPMYVPMVDKYEAKSFVSDRIGSEYIVPNYGVWNKFDEIDFSLLPDQFVLKCTHDSGGLVVVRNKKNLNMIDAKKKIDNCLHKNFFWHGREWQYKDIKPRIIAEKLLCDDQENPDMDTGLTDYKFFCFNGEPQFLYVSKGLENHSTASISFLTLDWKFADFQRADFKPLEKLPPKPNKLEEMIRISRVLSEGIPFVRVDLYCIKDNIYFSELTFTPCGGYMPFVDSASDLLVGEMLELPDKIK